MAAWFVLGGGGALGAYQAGQVAALLSAGVRPDGFAACSAGALNAAYLASDPTPQRAGELARWWQDAGPQRILATPRPHLLLRDLGRVRRGGLLDDGSVRALVADLVPAHDVSELAVPLSVTTTCLDCGRAEHHRAGPVADVLVASCALPGLFAPVVLADGHRHVDGGVLHGVPIAPALAAAGPDDVVYVLDCGLDPVTGRGSCAAQAAGACGLTAAELRAYDAPVERTRGPLGVALDAFTASRAVANRAAVAGLLDDPRVRVLPHVADAYAVGLLDRLPRGPRDTSVAAELVVAGRLAAARWLAAEHAAA